MPLLKRLIFIVMSFTLLLTVFSGCENIAEKSRSQQGRYSSFRDIPDITQEEIDAIENLRKNRTSFVYASTPSAEAFLGKNNKIRGYSALFSEWLSDLFQIPFVPAYYAWSDLLAGLDTGEIDFTGEMTLTEERVNPSDPNQKPYFMTVDAIAERTLKCFRLANTRPLTEITERPVKYAILRDTTTIIEVTAVLPEGTFEIVPIDDSDEVYSMLRNRVIDAYINEGPAEAIFDNYSDVLAEDFYPMIYSPVSLTTQNPELKAVISVVQKALEDGSKQHLAELYNRGYQEYLMNKLYFHLTDEERVYIENNAVIQIAVEYDNYPVTFYSKYENTWEGIGIDVLREIERFTGLRFEIANSPTTEWPALLKMLEDGEVSMISELIRSESREGRFLWPDNSIMADNPALISKSDFRNVSANEILYVTVGLSKDTAYTELFEKKFPNHANSIYYDDSDMALEALTRGEVDMMMTSYNKLLKATNYWELVGYKVNVMFDDRFESTYGFNKDEEILCSIIDKALNLIDTYRISAYWLNKTFDYNAKVLQAQRPWLIGTAVLSLLIAALGIILFIVKRHERQRLAALVHERTIELEAVINNYKGVIWSVDADGIIKIFNGQYLEKIGITPEFLVGKNIKIARAKNRHLDVIDNIDKALLEGPQEWTGEIDGGTFYSTARPIYDINNKVIGVVGSTDDITEMVRLQRNLETEQATLKAVFDSIPDFVFCKDLNLKYTKCNKSMEEHFGVREADLIGKDDEVGLGAPAEMVQSCNESDQMLINTSQITVSEEWVAGTGGKLIMCETIKSPIIKNGVVVGLTGVSRNITERKRAEKMTNALNEMSVLFLSQDENTYEDKMTEGVWLIAGILDLDRVSVWRNTMTPNGMNTSQIYRWDKESGGTTLPNPELQNIPMVQLLQDWEKLVTGEEVINGPVRLMENPPVALKQFGVISTLVTALVIGDEKWGFVLYEDRRNERYFDDESVKMMRSAAFLCANTIIRSEMENKLNKALHNATVASQAKSDFLSHMSHEIRTPLNAIIGMLNIGMNTEDDEKIQYCFDRASSASKHLLSIINDVLDMSKIEADKFVLSYSEIDFEKMLINITDVTNVKAEEKQLNFVVNLDKDVPSYIESDELRLSQIITNLLTNAIKFTPEKGTVELNIQKTEEVGDEIALRIEVADTGIGISQEQQEQLFTAFNQADTSITKKFGGTGLGLAISKRIVELMGGEIWVESELDKGAKFIFTMKAKKLADTPRARLSANIRAEEMYILAADDSPEARDYFVYVMEALNIPCDVAESGAEALDMLKNAGNKPYNIFFVDWQMPNMDGIELAKKIKEINGDQSIVILISGADWATIEKEAVASGVNYFVSKPLLPSVLINAINICMGEEIKEELINAQKRQTKQRYNFVDYTILIVEDVEINREIIGTILEETGVSIQYAENGKIAVSMFSKNPEKYDLILMDINMPEMDGYEAARRIRAIDVPRAKDIPIIAMTANVFKEDIEKCLEFGMNNHTGKPVDADALFRLLNRYLKHHEEIRKVNSVYELKQGIAWDEDLLTGNAMVDMQHKKIFERVSNLVHSCEDGSDIEKLQDTLIFLVDHAIQHFTDEEALQLEYNYPFYKYHKRLHDEFKVTVSELVHRFKESGSSAELSGDVNKIVVKWLITHIKNEDKKISDHIRSVTADR